MLRESGKNEILTGWNTIILYTVNNKRYTTRRRRNQHIRVYKFIMHACARKKSTEWKLRRTGSKVNAAPSANC